MSEIPGIIRKQSDTKPSNPKDAAATTRLDLSLFPATARAYGALAMVEGDQKYGGYNYREAGVRASIYYAAAGRHLDKWFNGEEDDPKTRVPHLANALACIAVLIDGIEKGNWTDDRPPVLDVTDLFDRFEKKVAHLHAIFPRSAARYTAQDQDVRLADPVPVPGCVYEHGVAVAEDGWVLWEGGDCPLGADVQVEIELRRGHRATERAGLWRWSKTDTSSDIIAYRVVKPT